MSSEIKFEKFRIGFSSVSKSTKVLTENPRLALFPVVGVTGAYVWVMAMWFSGLFEPEEITLFAFDNPFKIWLAVFLVWVPAKVILTFSEGAVVHAMVNSFRNEQYGFRNGIKGVLKARNQVFFWGVASGFVNVVLLLMRHIESFLDVPIVGTVLLLTVGILWFSTTFLVLPAAVLENASVTEMFVRSWKILDQNLTSVSGGITSAVVSSLLFGVVFWGISSVIITYAGGAFLYRFFGLSIGDIPSTVSILIFLAPFLVPFIAVLGVAKAGVYYTFGRERESRKKRIRDLPAKGSGE